MPQAGSRKRQAPGASPIGQDFAQSSIKYNTRPSPDPNDPLFTWDQRNHSTEDPTFFGAPEPPDISISHDAMVPQNNRQEASNQLARRGLNNQVTPKAPYNGATGDIWPDLMVEQDQQVEGAWQDDDTQLDQKALEAKKVAQSSRKSIPPFVQKLSSFLDESRNTDLIRWSTSGDSFIVLDEDEFARTLIPELFKHNNYASFVRQLNMYGFHKRVGLSDNSMRASERKNKSPSEYSNPYFKRGRPNLLWLIQKPKPSHGRGRGAGRGKQGEENGEDDVEDLFDGEPTQTLKEAPEDGGAGRHGARQPLMIGQGDRGLAKEELSAVHQELRNIRHQQQMISGVMAKIRREHEQLYGQAAAFQELHNRHENSINAILTFLATVYNRSLEGHGNQNMANLFGGAIPHDLQQQGTVVDVDDLSSPGVDSPHGLTSRPSKKPLLLKAPPENGLDANRPGGLPRPNSNLASPQERTRYGSAAAGRSPQASLGIVEEIYEQDSGQTPQFPTSNVTTPGIPERDIISIINSTNARDLGSPQNRMDFPEALSHLQNADGKSPLSPNERNSVLQLMANSNAQARSGGKNNALVSPNPPTVPLPNLETWNATEQDLHYLEKTLKEQDDKVANLSSMLQPLSPSGSIPGLNDSLGQGYMPPSGGEGLDFSQIFNTDDYFNDAPMTSGLDFPNGGNDFENSKIFSFDNPDGSGFGDDLTDDLQREDANAVNGSQDTSPANTMDGSSVEGETRSPRKRQRRGQS